jgi:hypothetical protein
MTVQRLECAVVDKGGCKGASIELLLGTASVAVAVLCAGALLCAGAQRGAAQGAESAGAGEGGTV